MFRKVVLMSLLAVMLAGLCFVPVVAQEQILPYVRFREAQDVSRSGDYQTIAVDIYSSSEHPLEFVEVYFKTKLRFNLPLSVAVFDENGSRVGETSQYVMEMAESESQYTATFIWDSGASIPPGEYTMYIHGLKWLSSGSVVMYSNYDYDLGAVQHSDRLYVYIPREQQNLDLATKASPRASVDNGEVCADMYFPGERLPDGDITDFVAKEVYSVLSHQGYEVSLSPQDTIGDVRDYNGVFSGVREDLVDTEYGIDGMVCWDFSRSDPTAEHIPQMMFFSVLANKRSDTDLYNNSTFMLPIDLAVSHEPDAVVGIGRPQEPSSYTLSGHNPLYVGAGVTRGSTAVTVTVSEVSAGCVLTGTDGLPQGEVVTHTEILETVLYMGDNCDYVTVGIQADDDYTTTNNMATWQPMETYKVYLPLTLRGR
jgi:hypothetical protein